MLKNKAKFSQTEIKAIFGDNNVFNLQNDEFIGVSIDTRTLANGEIFIPLIGEKNDAHNFIPEAYSKGAALAIISHSWYENNKHIVQDKPFVLVKDTLLALGELASFHRNRFDIPIIAVAGSNGKTTTKDMIAAVLSKKYKVLKTYQNFNNRIGVPLMIFNIDETIEFAVIEIGTNEPGEIYLLSQMLAPTAGIITNIGQEHLEKLIDINGVEMEETSLFGYLHRTKGVCFVNCDDERLAKYTQILDKKFTYSTENANVNIKINLEINNNLNPILHFANETNSFSIQLNTHGIASGYNAVAAFAVGYYYGLDIHQIKEALENYSQEKYSGYARMMLQEINGYTILNDCYNANPSSMLMSLNTLSKYTGKPFKAAILGDMRELGEHSLDLHLEILNYAAKICDKVFTIGEFMSKATHIINCDNVYSLSSFSEIADQMNNLKKDYAFLVKGSRGMKMEQLFELLK